MEHQEELLIISKNNNFEPKTIKTLVLDEFDKALELGFEEDMNFIISSLKNILSVFFTSATAMDNIPKFVGLDNEKTINF